MFILQSNTLKGIEEEKGILPLLLCVLLCLSLPTYCKNKFAFELKNKKMKENFLLLMYKYWSTINLILYFFVPTFYAEKSCNHHELFTNLYFHMKSTNTIFKHAKYSRRNIFYLFFLIFFWIRKWNKVFILISYEEEKRNQRKIKFCTRIWQKLSHMKTCSYIPCINHCPFSLHYLELSM